jgi:hypothetical protein
LVDGLDRRGLDMVRGIEIGFTGAETDDVLTRGFQGLGAGIDSEGGGRLDGLDAGGEHDGHRRRSLHA